MRISAWSSEVCASDLFAAERERSVCCVLIRAIERRTSLTRDAFSSWPVAAWKRRLNASRFSSPSCSASWSSVLALKSSVLDIALNPPGARCRRGGRRPSSRSEEHTSELQSLMRISYPDFCSQKKDETTHNQHHYY